MSHNIPLFEFSPAPGAFREKVIMITGASSGIGEALAHRCAMLGAELVLQGRNKAKLDAIHDSIHEKTGQRPVLLPIDFEQLSEAGCQDITEAIEASFGRLDALVHCASLLGKNTPISQYNADLWQLVMHVNLTAGFMLTKSLLPLLEKPPAASVIFSSSSVGRKARAYWGAYAVSKFATEGLMQVLADELGNSTRIRVNSINPGGTRTPMRAAAYPSENPASLPAPEDVLGQYLYLLDERSVGVHGQALDARLPV
jgi:NAD(P)-dependent dehydrogenase (short-subunit alcohol dehydrogenase family)